MSKPKAPAAPDYAGAAREQGIANSSAAVNQQQLNQVNQVTPDGSLRYSTDGFTIGPDGTPIPNRTATTTLSPGQQTLYDQNQQISTELNRLAQRGVDYVGNTINKEFDLSGTPMGRLDGQSMPEREATPDAIAAREVAAREVGTRGVGTQGATARYLTTPEATAARLVSAKGPIAGSNPNDYAAANKATIDAIMSRVNPQLDRRQAAIDSQLANQGITQGSEAYKTEQELMGQQRNDAAQQAQIAGNAQQLALQQQSFAQAMASQEQNFGQELAAAGQNFGQEFNSANRNFDNAFNVAGQNFCQDLAVTNQGFGQNMAVADQGFNQDVTAANLGFNQQLSAANLGFGQQLSSQAQRFGQGDTLANRQLGTQGQLFNQGLASADFANRAQQQNLQTQSFLRDQPLNSLNALRTGAQVPQFQISGQNNSIAAAPIYQAADDQYQGALDAYKQQMAGFSSLLGGLGSLGSAAITKSDRRVKEHIERIGVMPSGLPVYRYSYIGSPLRWVGVMAQEVAMFFPEALGITSDGFLGVNYAMVR